MRVLGWGSISQRYGSGSGSFPFLILSRLKDWLQNKILTQNLGKKIKFLRLTIMCLPVIYKKKIRKKLFFASLKSLKKAVGSWIGSGSISQRCRIHTKMSGNPNTGRKHRYLLYLEWHSLHSAIWSSSLSVKYSQIWLRFVFISFSFFFLGPRFIRILIAKK